MGLASIYDWALVMHSPPTESRRRIFPLLFYSLLSFANALQWVNYSPIPTICQSFYGMNNSEINLTGNIYTWVYFAMILFPCLAMHRMGIRTNLLLGCLFNFLGAALKLVAGWPTNSFTVVIIAQAIASVANVFLLSAPPSMAAVWFPVKERAAATSIASASNALGTAIGLLIPPYLVKPNNPKDGFLLFYGIQTAWCFAILLGAFFLVPSARCAEPVEKLLSAKVIAKNMLKAAWDLIQNISFMIHLIGTSVSIGIIWTVNFNIYTILAPTGLNFEALGWISFSNIVCGVAFAFLVGFIVARLQWFKWPVVIFAVVNVALTLGLIFLIKKGTNAPENAIWAVDILAGLPQNALAPVAFELGVELTHPYPDSVSPAAIMVGGNIVYLIISQIFGKITPISPTVTQATNGMWLLWAFLAVGMILHFLPREKLKRLQAEIEELDQQSPPASGSPLAVGSRKESVSDPFSPQ